MRMGIRKSQKAAIVLTIMLACLIVFSQTIRGWLHPRVKVEAIHDGTVEMIWNRDQVEVLDYGKTYSGTSAVLSSALKAESQSVRSGEAVTKGQVLFTLSPEEVDRAYFLARQKYINALTALDGFRDGYKLAYENAEKQLESAQKTHERLQKTTAESRKKQAQEDYERAQRNYDRIAEGIFNGTSLDVLEYQLAQAEEELNQWESIRKKDYAICSPGTGTILNASFGFPYQFTLLSQGEEVQIRVSMTFNDGMGINKNQEAWMEAPIISGEGQKIHVTKVEGTKNGTDVTLQFVPVAPAVLEAGSQWSIHMQSARYPALVPNGALAGDDTVWVAVQQDNKWIARQKKIEHGTGNAYYTPCMSTELEGSYAIVQWDLELAEGEEIVIR